MNNYSFVKAMNQIIGLPAKDRHLKIHEQFNHLDKQQLLQIICALTDVTIDYTQSCDEAVWLHLIGKGDYHPHAIDDLNLPSLAGSLNGLLLDEFAPVKKGLCSTCAYRRGTLGNSSTSTQADVDYAFLMDTSFSCHKQADQAGGINDEVKSCLKPCKGWIQHKKYLEKQIKVVLGGEGQ